MKFSLSSVPFPVWLVLILSLLLFVAIHTSSNGESANVHMQFNSSAEWATLLIEGGKISNIQINSADLNINQQGNLIKFNNAGHADFNIHIVDITAPQVQFYLGKSPKGVTILDMPGIGTLKAEHEPITIPIILNTSSSEAIIRGDGITIEGAEIIKQRGLVSPPEIKGGYIRIQNPTKENINVEFIADISIQDKNPTIILEKSDGGGFEANISGYHFLNEKNGYSSVKGVPLRLEMTSNTTQLSINKGDIVKAGILSVDGADLIQHVVGGNFIYIKYNTDGNRYQTATYNLDLNLSSDSTIEIQKSNQGFAHAILGEEDYFVSEYSSDDLYHSAVFSVSKLLKDASIPMDMIEAPITIDVSSDWAKITLNGLDGLEISNLYADDNLQTPEINNNQIIIKKKDLTDLSTSRVSGILHAEQQNKPTFSIEKGDLGTTTVRIGDISLYVNNNVQVPSNNKEEYPLPNLPTIQITNISSNPEAFSFPAYQILSDYNKKAEDTQDYSDILTKKSGDLSGYSLTMNKIAARGIALFVFLGYLIIGLSLFIRRYPDYLSRISLQDLQYIKNLPNQIIVWIDELSLSSVIVLNALCCLISTPIILMLVNESAANEAAIVAYLLLVVAVILRGCELKGLIHLKQDDEITVKGVILMFFPVAGFSALYSFMNKINIIVCGGSIFFVGVSIICVYKYLSYHRDSNQT